MSTRSSKLKLFIIIVAVLAIVAVLLDPLHFFEESQEYSSYEAFLEALQNRSISQATVEAKTIQYQTSGGTFVVQNPQSTDIVERLLASGAQVQIKDQASLNAALDIVFDIIFFGAIGFGAWKLLDTSRKTFKVVHRTGVTFNDIAGMKGVKEDMMFLVQVLKNPKAFEAKGLRPVKGVILEGPPGNGKTLFAKALAQEANVNFIATRGADFQSAMMSMGARKIKMLFNKANRKKPCIVFIDEFDSIGERRNYAGTGIDKENNRIITTMLNEMDGFTANNGILVIAATNSYASLDPALIRPGRFDLKYSITNPDAQTRAQLVDIYTKGRTFESNITKDMLVVTFDGLSCSAIETVLNEAYSLAEMSKSSVVTTEHLLTAAHKTGAKLNIKRK